MRTYQQNLNLYAEQLRGLYAAEPEAGGREARRGGALLEATTLADRAEKLADLSEELAAQHQNYLESGQANEREGAEFKLLTQANADLQVAASLFEFAEHEERGQKKGARRGGSSASTAKALAELASTLEIPIEQGIQPFIEKKVRRGRSPENREKACTALVEQVDRSLRQISRQASRTCSSALDTLFSLDAELLEKGAALVSKQIAEQIDKVISGLTAAIRRLVTTAVRLLLQAYDLVLSLLGKDAEASARKKVKEWVEELRNEHKQVGDESGLAEGFVSRIYASIQINEDVKAWVNQTKTGLEALNQVTKQVGILSEGYELKAKRVQDTLKTVSSARGFARAGAVRLAPLASALPYLEILAAGVILGLMGYSLYAGYDHVDSGSATFFKRFAIKIPDRVVGVRETIQNALAAS
jgi:hypothetical protein